MSVFPFCKLTLLKLVKKKKNPSNSCLALRPYTRRKSKYPMFRQKRKQYFFFLVFYCYVSAAHKKKKQKNYRSFSAVYDLQHKGRVSSRYKTRRKSRRVIFFFFLIFLSRSRPVIITLIYRLAKNSKKKKN